MASFVVVIAKLDAAPMLSADEQLLVTDPRVASSLGDSAVNAER
jgi:hypothetical protein